MTLVLKYVRHFKVFRAVFLPTGNQRQIKMVHLLIEDDKVATLHAEGNVITQIQTMLSLNLGLLHIRVLRICAE